MITASLLMTTDNRAWEKLPNMIGACIDARAPGLARRSIYG